MAPQHHVGRQAHQAALFRFFTTVADVDHSKYRDRGEAGGNRISAGGAAHCA
jgi:hypothetical protein